MHSIIFSYFWYSSLFNWKSLMTLTETLESIIMWSLKWDTSCAALFRSQSKLHLFILPVLLHSISHNSQCSRTGLGTWHRQGLHPLATAFIQCLFITLVIQYLLNEWHISSGILCWLIGSYWEDWWNCIN